MGSVLRRVRSKQRSGEVEVMAREEYAGLDVDAKVELIRGLIPLGLMHVHELLDDEVVALAGPRHAESVNALVEERCAKVHAWKTSHQSHRWLATALLDVEPRLRRVKRHQHLPKPQAALRRALHIKSDVVREKQAA